MRARGVCGGECVFQGSPTLGVPHPLASPAGTGAGAGVRQVLAVQVLGPKDAAGLGGGIASPKLSPLLNLLLGGLGGGPKPGHLALAASIPPAPPAMAVQGSAEAGSGPGWSQTPQLHPPQPGRSLGCWEQVPHSPASPRPAGALVFPNPGRRDSLLIKCINS